MASQNKVVVNHWWHVWFKLLLGVNLALILITTLTYLLFIVYSPTVGEGIIGIVFAVGVTGYFLELLSFVNILSLCLFLGIYNYNLSRKTVIKSLIALGFSLVVAVYFWLQMVGIIR